MVSSKLFCESCVHILFKCPFHPLTCLIVIFPWPIRFIFFYLLNHFYILRYLFYDIGPFSKFLLIWIPLMYDSLMVFMVSKFFWKLCQLFISSVNHLWLCWVLYDADQLSIWVLHGHSYILWLLLRITVRTPLHFPAAAGIHN